MFKGRWIEFYEAGDKGLLAMRNLTIFLTITISSGIIIYLTALNRLTPEVFGEYLLAGGGVYSFGKWSDDKTSRAQIDANTTPSTVPQNVTNISHPEGDINVAGDTVTKQTKRKK